MHPDGGGHTGEAREEEREKVRIQRTKEIISGQVYRLFLSSRAWEVQRSSGPFVHKVVWAHEEEARTMDFKVRRT